MRIYRPIAVFITIIFFISCNQIVTTDNKLASFFAYSPEKEVLISAHRGGKGYAGYPENCLESMQFIKQQIPNAIFEIDIAQSKDSILLLMHDDALERTSTGFGRVDQTDWKMLSQLNLKDDFDSIVDFKIPLFADILVWAKKENAILTVDIKRSVDAEKVLHFIEKVDALSQSVIITYSIEAAKKLYALNPEVVLSVSIRNMEEFERAAKSGIPWKNMVAFTGIKESDLSLYQKLHQKGVMCMLGTLGNLDKKAATKGDHLYKEWSEKGIDIFATDRPLEVKKVFAK